MKCSNLKGRICWLKNNPPKDISKEKWNKKINTEIETWYSFSFNHPYYGFTDDKTDNELRHELLDQLNVPRKVENEI